MKHGWHISHPPPAGLDWNCQVSCTLHGVETSPAKPRLVVDSFGISNATYSATSAASGFPILRFGILWSWFASSFRLRLAFGLGFCQGGFLLSLCSSGRLLGFPALTLSGRGLWKDRPGRSQRFNQCSEKGVGSLEPKICNLDPEFKYLSY